MDYHLLFAGGGGQVSVSHKDARPSRFPVCGEERMGEGEQSNSRRGFSRELIYHISKPACGIRLGVAAVASYWPEPAQ